MRKIKKDKKLNPCPFCGSKDLSIVVRGGSGTNNKVVCVKCNNCHTYGPRVYAKGLVGEDKEDEALALWNHNNNHLLNKILSFLKSHKSKGRIKLFLVPKRRYTNEQLELFNDLEVGDVVYALMPVNKDRLKNIPDGHKERPYVVVGKTDKDIIGYQCSSKDVKSSLSYLSYPFSQSVYNTGKSSYIHLDNVYYIPIGNLRFKYKTLYLNTLLKLNKRLSISNFRGAKLPMFSSAIYPPETGDIIRYNNQNYYVNKVADNKIHTYKVYMNIEKDKKDDYCYIKNSKHSYYISVSEKEVIDIDSGYVFTDIISKDKISELTEKIKAYKQSLNQTNKVDYKQVYPVGKMFYIGMDDYLYLYHKNKKMYVLEKQDGEFYLRPKGYETKNERYFKDNGLLDKGKFIDIIKDVIESGKDEEGILVDILNKLDNETNSVKV